MARRCAAAVSEFATGASRALTASVGSCRSGTSGVRAGKRSNISRTRLATSAAMYSGAVRKRCVGGRAFGTGNGSAGTPRDSTRFRQCASAESNRGCSPREAKNLCNDAGDHEFFETKANATPGSRRLARCGGPRHHGYGRFDAVSSIAEGCASTWASAAWQVRTRQRTRRGRSWPRCPNTV